MSSSGAKRLQWWLVAAVWVVALPVHAAYYTVDSGGGVAGTYPWQAPTGAATNVTLGDDAVTAAINLPFTFNFGGTDYTQVRIHSDGRVYMGAGTTNTTYTNTAMPTTVDNAVMPFWDDLHPGGVASRIRYETFGSGANEIFVVSWIDMPHYCNNTGACTSNQTNAPLRYTFQVQFHETTNDIIFWYNTMGATGGAISVGSYNDGGATIGVEIDASDYTQHSFNTNSISDGQALRFYFVPFAGANLEAEYHMDETTWGTVTDSSGNGRDASASGSTAPDDFPMANPPDEAINTNPGTCGAGNISGAGGGQQVSTPIDPATHIGNAGTIAFWYSGHADWDDNNDRLLFDASNNLGNGGADKHFYLSKDDDGALVFAIEDSADTNSTATTANSSRNADEWHHIAVTWDLPNDVIRIFVDGVEADNSTTNVNGTLGNTDTLYIGDQRSGSIAGDAGQYTANSANGYIDEVKIYDRALIAAEVALLMAETHSCGSMVDHYLISHGGSMVTCAATNITITAHDTGHNAVNPAAATNLSIATTTTRGTWASVVAGTGSLSDPTPGNPDNGDATYAFPGTESAVTLSLRYTNPATDPELANFNVTDSGGNTEATGTAAGDSDDANISVASTGFLFYNSTDANTTIPTQIAAKRSDLGFGSRNLALRAVRASDSDPSVCTGVFANGADVTVQLGAECKNPANCAGQQVSVTNNGNTGAIATNNNNSAVLTSSYSNVLLRFLANSTAELHLDYPDAGQMQMHARYDLGNPAGTYMIGSSNDYVVRPFGFNVVATGNPAAANHNGAVYTAAGSSFTVTATAKGWQAGDDGNNDGIPDGHALADTDPTNNDDLSDNTTLPNFGQESGGGEDITLSAALDQPSGGANPGLAGGTSITLFTAGVGSTTTARYGEVGIIELSAVVSDGDYLGIGATPTGLARSKSGRVGRFRPDNFNVTGNTPTFAPGCNADTTDFTYFDQPFEYATAPQVTITARNVQNATTANYDGVWWKLGSFSAGYAHDGGALPGGTTLDSAAATHTAVDCSGDTCNGVFVSTFDGPFTYTRTVTPAAPFNAAVDITLGNITDSDAVAYAGNPFKFENIVFTGGANQQRWGRILLGEAVGDPTLALDVPVTTEYYNGTAFVQNPDDDCSAFNLAGDVTLANEATPGSPLAGDQAMNIGAGTTSVTSGNGLMANGLDTMTFSAPGASNTGLVDILLDLDTGTGADLPWLYFDWDDDGSFDTTVEGRGSFGIYSQPDSMIYMREPW